MHIQNSSSYSIIYDIEKDKYFRVNKLTGQVQDSFKTGQKHAKFDPLITGTSYIARKQNRLKQLEKIKQGHSKKNSHNLNQLNFNKSVSQSLNLRNHDLSNMEKTNTLNNSQQNLIKNKQKKVKNIVNNQIEIISQKSATRLPRIKKQNSLSIIQTKNISHFNSAQMFKNLRNSQNNVNSTIISSKNKENKAQFSFFNSVSKLSLMSYQNSVSNSRMNLSNFENKLKKYAELQKSKLEHNNFNSLEEKMNQKVKNTGQTSLLTSFLDQSELKEQNIVNISKIQNIGLQQKSNSTINRVQVDSNLQNLFQQRQGLLILAKECQQANKSLSIKKLKQSTQNLTNPKLKGVDLLQAERKVKLKQQMVKQKQQFLSFYPHYAFKENPRLIQEQKDRRINFKKLEKLFLQNNQKKYGRIYRSKSKQTLETI